MLTPPIRCFSPSNSGSTSQKFLFDTILTHKKNTEISVETRLFGPRSMALRLLYSEFLHTALES